MNRIVASVKNLIVLSVLAVVYLFITVICLIEGIGAVSRGGGAAGWLFTAFAIFLSLFLYMIFDLNRTACIISLDGDTVKRRGLIWGFRKECRISLIRAVHIKEFYRDGDYICLIDGSAHKFKKHRHDSYICFEYSKENMLFLRRFWHGKVKEYEL